MPDTGLQAAQQEMVRQRREGEAALGHQLESDDWWVVCDGTDGRLYIPRPDGTPRRIVGCIKSQHVQLLPEPYARQLAELPENQRTTIFRTPSNRYSCYLRLGPARPWEAPLAGIVRLEFAGSFNLSAVRNVADTFAGQLPQFGRTAYRSARAAKSPTYRALENQLRRQLGDSNGSDPE